MIYNSIEQVDRTKWNDLTQGYPFVSCEWCQFAEHILDLRYVAIEAADGYGAGAVLQVEHHPALPIENNLARGAMHKLLATFPLIQIASPFTTGQAVFLRDATLLPSLCQQLEQAARSVRASFINVSYMPEPSHYNWPNGYVVMEENFLPSTILENQWEDWQAYKAFVKSVSKSRERDIRKQFRYADENGWRCTFSTSVDAPQKAAQLYKERVDSYESDDHDYTRRLFEHAALNSNIVWMSVYEGNKLLLSELLLFDPREKVLEPILYGRQPDVQNIYFYSWYKLLQYAIEELKVKRIIGNTHGYKVKESLGFDLLHTSNVVVTSPSPVLKMLLRLFA